jgi:hypothetical protein
MVGLSNIGPAIKGSTMQMRSVLLALVAMGSLTTGSLAQFPPAAEPAAGPYEYFRLGEIALSLTDMNYYLTIGDKLKPRLDEHRAYLQKLKVGPESLTVYDALTALALELPFQKERDYEKWSPEDRKRWSTQGTPKAVQLRNHLKAYVAKDPKGEFYYWLGSACLETAWTIPQDLAVGLKISESSVKPVLETFAWLQNHKEVASLAPDAAAALKSIAAMKARLDDPLEGLGKDDVKKMATLAQSIRDVAREKQLLR